LIEWVGMPNAAETMTAIPQKESAPREKKSAKRPKEVTDRLMRSLDALIPREHLPELLAKGGENLVFTFEEEIPAKTGSSEAFKKHHPNIVAKVNFLASAAPLHAYIQNEKNETEEIRLQEVERYLQDEIKLRRLHLNDLRISFGKDAVPAEVTLVRRMPISWEAVQALEVGIEATPEQIPAEFPLQITIQRRLPEVQSKISLTGYYVEKSLPFGPEWQTERARDAADQQMRFFQECERILGEGDLGTWDYQDLLQIVMDAYPTLTRPIQSESASLRKALRTLTKNMRQYTQKTGNVLDLAGQDNVLLIERNNRWEPRLLDVIIPNECSMREAVRAAGRLKGLQPGKHLNLRDTLSLMNALNTVRLINALTLIGHEPSKPERFKKGKIPLLRIPEFAGIDANRWMEELKYHKIF